MARFSFVALAATVSVSVSATSCSPRSHSVSPRVLAAADPAAAEAPFAPPPSALDDAPPRTLGLDIADPARMKHPATPPEIGTPADQGGHDHSGHATPTPKPAATPKPTATPHDHGHPKAETVYSCPMHPEVRDTKPGSCPKCGMTLEPVSTPTPTSTPRPSPSAAPTPGGHDHNHRSSS